MNDQHADHPDPEGKGPRDPERLIDQDRRGSRTPTSGGPGALAERPSRPGPHARRRARAGVRADDAPGEPAEVCGPVVEDLGPGAPPPGAVVVGRSEPRSVRPVFVELEPRREGPAWAPVAVDPLSGEPTAVLECESALAADCWREDIWRPW
jgi:hypothetical protein